MDAELKKKIIRVITGAVVLILGACWLNSCQKEKEAEEAAVGFRKGVNPIITDARGAVDNRPEMDFDFKIDELIRDLHSVESSLKQNKEKAQELEEWVKRYNQEPQPQQVIDACQSRVEQLEKLQAKKVQLQQKAEQMYAEALERWPKLSAQIAAAEERVKRMAELRTELDEKRKEAEKRRNATKPDWEARRIYRQIIRRINRVMPLLEAEIAHVNLMLKGAYADRDRVMGQNNVVDHAKPDMVTIDGIMKRIREDFQTGDEGELPLPPLKVAPPPPPFEPDMVLAATGDLPEALLMPLVEQWLRERQAKPLEGKNFVWVAGKDGSREMEVKVPAVLNGKEKGKLRIRVLPAMAAEQAFAAMGAKESIDLLLTGQTPTEEMMKAWLPENKTLQQLDELTHGRSFRARVCYDALVFFRGNDYDVASVRSSALQEQAKVFSVNDKARAEAVCVCGMQPGTGDVEETAQKNISDLCREYADKMVMGVWHKDAAGNVSVKKQPTICYAAGWESEEAQKSIPEEYRASSEGVPPTAESIASGRYAYGYSIYFYRNARQTNTRGSQLARDLLLYAADAENAKVAEVINSCNFVPVKLGLDTLRRSSRLTKDDLPLPVLLRKMGPSLADEYGYGDEETKWVYGVRIPMPLYYETGSAEASEDGVSLDPDAAYYTTETQAFDRIRDAVGQDKAIVLVLGHADPQWGKALKVDSNSWKQNLRLSEKRASIVGKKKVQPKMKGAANIRHMELGSGWARPACDISLSRSLTEQQNELARSRRVEVFIIFPVSGEADK